MEEVVSGQVDGQEPAIDYALLRPPINTGLSGAMQVFKCMQNGTDELNDMLQYECDLIFECKVCRSMFRGLPNFISHKRVFCTKYHQDHLIEFVKPATEDETIVVEPKTPEEKDSQENVSTVENQSPSKPVLNQVLEGSFQGTSSTYQFYTRVTEEVGRKKEEKNVTVVHLKPIQGNNNAVFQTVKESTSCIKDNIKVISDSKTNESANISGSASNSNIVKESPSSEKKGTASKSKNSALLEALCRNTGIVKPPTKSIESRQESADKKPVKKEPASFYSPNKSKTLKSKWGNNPIPIAVKLAQRKDCNLKTLTCLKCNTQYSSRKTLHFHMVSIHSEKRRFYPCIYCGTTFVQMWGVVRHVIRTHKKSRDQVEKLRDALRKKSFTKKVTTGNVFRTKPESPTSVPKPATSSTGNTVKTRNQEKALLSAESSKISRSPRQPPAAEDKTTIQFTQNFTLHKCSWCGKAFARKDALDRHLGTCSKKGEKVEDDISSTMSSVSLRPKRTIKAKRTLYESDSDEDKIMPAKKGKLLENVKGGKNVKRNSSITKATSASKPEKGSSPKQSGPGYINWEKVDQLIDKEKLICKKCKAQYSNLHNVRRHVCLHMGWNRYKCKLCKYSAFHPCECRRHLSRAHPAVYKRNSDYTKFIVDLHKKDSNAAERKKANTGSGKLKKNKKNQKTRSKSVKKATTSEKSSKKKETNRLMKKKVTEENPYARSIKKIPAKPVTANSVNKLTTLFTRSGHYPKSNDVHVTSKHSPKNSTSDCLETSRGQLILTGTLNTSGSKSSQSPRGKSPQQLDDNPSKKKESPVSRVREGSRLRTISRSPVKDSPNSLHKETTLTLGAVSKGNSSEVIERSLKGTDGSSE